MAILGGLEAVADEREGRVGRLIDEGGDVGGLGLGERAKHEVGRVLSAGGAAPPRRESDGNRGCAARPGAT